MLRAGDNFKSFDAHHCGGFGFDGLPPGYSPQMPRLAIVAGMSKAPMKARSTTVEMTLESAVVLRALVVPLHCVDVLIEAIRVDGHDLIVDTRGVPYAAIAGAQERGSISSAVAHRKVTIVGKRWVERRRRLEIRRKGSTVRTKFVERVVSRTSRRTRFSVALQCMVLPCSSG